MEAHEARVVTEKRDLDDKLSRLRPFIAGKVFPTLPADEQERMRRQLGIMDAYSQVLGERIAAFPKARPGQSAAFDAVMFGDKGAALLAIAAFGASYGSQYTGAEGWRAANIAFMALALVLALVSFVHLALI